MKLTKLNVKDFPTDFDWYNDQYPPLDALTYWHYLKKAKQVIEVGCGFSTLLSYKSGTSLTAIDPTPRIIYPSVEYIFREVQQVDVAVFEKLNKGDILFIDSSHIYQEGSDVYFLIHEVLPKLKKGVIIHFHDYFGEEDYPAAWKEIPHMRDWNENSQLSLLKDSYDVLAENYTLSKENNDKLKEMYPFVPTDITTNLGAVKGASLWLKK